MKYNKIYEEIIEIPNFLSEENCKKIIEILESSSEEFWIENNSSNWNKRIFSNNLKNIYNKKLYPFKKIIKQQMLDTFGEFYKITNDLVIIQRMIPNSGGLDEHKDNIKDPDVKYGIVLYYNDDYEGGEIEYPEIKISYKPKVGSLIIHKAEYSHKVNEVFFKTRYMSTFFIEEIKKYPQDLNHNYIKLYDLLNKDED